MNCDEFSTHWNAHVARVLEAGDETAMLEHSRGCHSCGTRWRQHDELTHLLASVIEPHKPPPNLAVRLVEKLPPPTVPRPSLGDHRPPPPTQQSGPLLLAALAGGALVYALTGLGGGQNGANPVTEQMMYMEVLSRGTRGMGGIGGVTMLGMAARDLVSVLIAMAFLVWVTRASFWPVLFPIRMPAGIALARWVAIPAVLVGVLRLLCSVMILLMAWSNAMGGGGGMGPGLAIWMATSQLLDQLWTFGFWLALLALTFGVLNELTTRYARPLQ